MNFKNIGVVKSPPFPSITVTTPSHFLGFPNKEYLFAGFSSTCKNSGLLLEN